MTQHAEALAKSPYNKSVDILSMPDRVRRLPISPEGFPVPWFVAWFKDGKISREGEGVPDFRVINTPKIGIAVKRHLCWLCGEPIGQYKAFLIGPMCAINRVISEPPQHRDCAIYAARVCPFLSKPNMARNEKGLLDDKGDSKFSEPAGVALKRNPGVVCVWVTKSYRIFQAEAGQPGNLFSLGRPTDVIWFAQGRRATRAEVLASIDSGYPLLQDAARQDGAEALKALETQRTVAMALIPD